MVKIRCEKDIRGMAKEERQRKRNGSEKKNEIRKSIKMWEWKRKESQKK